MVDNVDNKYAEVLLDIAIKQNLLQDFYNQAQNLLVILQQTNELNRFLSDECYSKQERKQAIEDIFNNEINQIIIYWMWSIIDFSRSSNFIEIFKLFLKFCQEYLGIEFVQIISAHELSDEQIDKLSLAIKKRFNIQKIETKFIIDKSLIAGLRIKAGETIIDNSLLARLHRLKRHTLYSKDVIGE